MDELIQILSDVKDDVDFANCTTLIDDGILNSFDGEETPGCLRKESEN